MNGPFQFRIVEELTQNPKDVIPPYWQRFIKDKFHKEDKVKF